MGGSGTGDGQRGGGDGFSGGGRGGGGGVGEPAGVHSPQES